MIRTSVPEGDLHVWHFCKTGEHAKCLGFGSLVRRIGSPGKTYIEVGTKGHGLRNVYCECACHANKEVKENGQ